MFISNDIILYDEVKVVTIKITILEKLSFKYNARNDNKYFKKYYATFR